MPEDLGTPLYDAAAWDHGFAPIHRPLGAVRIAQHEPICPRCTTNGTPGDYCAACRVEIAHTAPVVDMVVTRGGMNRPDVRCHPVTVDPWGAA